ncbi:RNase J family beta-CASP ribonuclease [archaeon]|jgi:ribonuclease J|nr:RNase J family beta-CASP ribonuclease [archaeon]MBT6823914.1 RNase J family beta-CASP ribonuclease [archaeon]MBT7106792.1 RNase J family beta-CASP ribonuclease [archaeon]MBT7297288.1 RNase J family beta-CASP ribonuclease [archaeon]
MNVEIIALGGYSEVGKNMTAIKVGDEIVVLDCGFYLPSLVEFQEGGGNKKYLTPKGLQKIGAIPDDTYLESNKDKVKAFVVSHAHLDHVGAIPYVAGKYNAPVIATPYTIEVLRTLARDDDVKIKNKLMPTKTGSIIKVSKNISIELINMTHSTIDVASIAVHTPEGVIVYTNDFKFDNHPVVGKKPDYKRLKELGDEGNVRALILDSLYSAKGMKTPSEKVARELLKDVMLGAENKGHAIFITSFASHMARLKSMIDFAKKLDRKVVFMGRSLSKYTKAAENVGLVDYSKDANILTYSRQVQKMLKTIEKNRDKYVVVCTGSQAEPNAILSRIGNKQLPFNFVHDDHIIFSCKTIPVEPNISNREKLEKQLTSRGVRIFRDIHVSGHGSIEDMRDMIDMVKPEIIIPGHGDYKVVSNIEQLTDVIGYKPGKNLIYLTNGKSLKLK